jgi:hypothetical protein
MKKLAALATLVLALFAGSASISEAKVPGFGTQDSCAASLFTEDAGACGGTNWHEFDSGCYHPSVTFPGEPPYWAIFICWNPADGWHRHVWY